MNFVADQLKHGRTKVHILAILKPDWAKIIICMIFIARYDSYIDVLFKKKIGLPMKKIIYGLILRRFSL